MSRSLIVQEPILNRIPFRRDVKIGRTALESMEVSAWTSILGEECVKFQTSLLADQLPPAVITRSKDFIYPVPDGWWNHFKHQYANRWWLRWFARRRPASFLEKKQRAEFTVNVERYYTFPKANVRLPDKHLGEPVKYAQVDAEINFPRVR